MRGSRTRRIALSAVLAALSVVFLYLAGVFAPARLTFAAAASLFTAAAVIETGIGPAALVYACTAALGLILLPDKTAALAYVVFFGYYPIMKSLAERLRRPVVGWAIKMAVFNAAFFAAWLLFRAVIFSRAPGWMGLPALAAASNAVFVLFDIGLTRLIAFYIIRISKQVGGGGR